MIYKPKSGDTLFYPCTEEITYLARVGRLYPKFNIIELVDILISENNGPHTPRPMTARMVHPVEGMKPITEEEFLVASL